LPTLPPESEIKPTATLLQPETLPTDVVTTTLPTEGPAVTASVPSHPTPAPSAGPQLAFLKDGDVWLLDQPDGKPYPLTVLGNLFSFAWAPDGERMAVFDGRQICMVHRDGSVRTACLDLGLDDMQSKIQRLMIWSPDQTYIVLWNPVNPWDEGAIGWMIVALDGSNITYRIEDPVDWGASLAPNNDQGGIMGQPVYLADGKLVGTLTHRWLCGSGGCHYKLYQFDFDSRSFVPYPNKPEEGWSEGLRLVLSADQRLLANFGTFYNGCENYFTFMDIFNLTDQTRQVFDLDQEAVSDMALSPDAQRALIARSAGCSTQNTATWDEACGLSQGFDIYPMQFWELASNQRSDALPGVMPAWSPDGKWLAFRSCLASSDSGAWEPSATTPASIYIMDASGNKLTLIAEGSLPAWRPGGL
jgi:hypothetical protein